MPPPRAAMHAAGIDGVEFDASHGYLPAQFFNPRVNRRSDAYGGDLENRLRFAVDALSAMRAATSEDFAIGMRISTSERDEQGLTGDEALDICRRLEPLLDYVSLTAGTSASLGGAVHIVPPMASIMPILPAMPRGFARRLPFPSSSRAASTSRRRLRGLLRVARPMSAA